MKTVALLGLVGAVSGQSQTCEYHDGPNGEYVLNLTSIYGWRMEFESPGNFFYYSPCHNGENCQQGNANFYGNAVQYVPGDNTCKHWLAVDHHEHPRYIFGGASWYFEYEDGEVCDVTQQPRRVNVWYQCDEVMNAPAVFYDAYEPETCVYDFVIRSPLACVPQERHNANCQWKFTPQGSADSVYLDLSSQKGAVIRDHMSQNGYQHYYTPCQNGLHCYQQAGDVTVMSMVENDVTHTCDHYLAEWQEGRVQPLFHDGGREERETHWSFHYWLSQKCSNGEQGEETIRWYCDPKVGNYSLINATYDGDCRWEMNIASELACPSNSLYTEFEGHKMPVYNLKY